MTAIDIPDDVDVHITVRVGITNSIYRAAGSSTWAASTDVGDQHDPWDDGPRGPEATLETLAEAIAFIERVAVNHAAKRAAETAERDARIAELEQTKKEAINARRRAQRAAARQQ